MFPLTLKQQRAMVINKNFAQVKTQLEDKFNNKPDKVTSTLATIMSRHKVNPLASLLVLIIQMPILLSMYSSISHLVTSIGSHIVPWILSVSHPDSLHILPIIAGLAQGLTILTVEERNLMLFLPMVIGVVFLWKASAGLSVYWLISSIYGYLEKRIFKIKYIQQRFLKVPTTDEMLQGVS